MSGPLGAAWSSRRLAWIAAWACALAIAWASLSPRGAPLPRFSGADKVGHAVAYLVLAAAWAHLLRLGGQEPRRAALTALALAAAYGGALEGLQSFVPHRVPELLDACANTAGAAVGAFLSRGAPLPRPTRTSSGGAPPPSPKGDKRVRDRPRSARSQPHAPNREGSAPGSVL